MTGNVIDIRNLSVDAVGRRGERTPIVQDISFSVAPGKVVALIGESGSGKTTISLGCLGYTRPGCAFKGGEILLDGKDVLQLDLVGRQQMRGVDISYVAQSAAASFNGALSINRQVTRNPVDPRPDEPRGCDQEGRRALRRAGSAVTGDDRPTLSPPGQRRPVAAPDGGDGDDVQPASPDPRRTDHGARRHDPDRGAAGVQGTWFTRTRPQRSMSATILLSSPRSPTRFWS